jgi:hypothetical protein
MGLKIVGAIWDLPAQPIQANFGGNGPHWLSYLAGKSHTAPTIFFLFLE